MTRYASQGRRGDGCEVARRGREAERKGDARGKLASQNENRMDLSEQDSAPRDAPSLAEPTRSPAFKFLPSPLKTVFMNEKICDAVPKGI